MRSSILMPWLLLSSLALVGCQSPGAVQPVAVACPKPPPPDPQFMQRRESNSTQRLLNELSP